AGRASEPSSAHVLQAIADGPSRELRAAHRVVDVHARAVRLRREELAQLRALALVEQLEPAGLEARRHARARLDARGPRGRSEGAGDDARPRRLEGDAHAR